MPEEPEGPRAKPPKRPETARPRPGLFVLKSAGLLALTAVFYWVGWRSPLARADQAVRVEIADPPHAAPASPKAVAPSGAGGETSSGGSGETRPAGAESERGSSREPDIEDESKSPETSASGRGDEQQDERTTHRRRARRHRATADRSDRE